MMHGLKRETRRAMRRERRRRQTELNIVSMIDVLTVLVFFLLVNMSGLAILGINLPDAHAQVDEKARGLSVAVYPTHMLVLDRSGPLQDFPNNAEGFDLAGVARFLRRVKEEDPGQTAITLMMDNRVAYNILIELMDAARVQPTPDGHGERDLFPQISLGDAPPEGKAP
jgi:biopolymer transport protein ExbD